VKKLLILLSIFITINAFAETKTVSIGEYNISYEIAGQGKHTILLEAGMGQSLSTWDPIYSDISKYAKVIRYSRVGHGGSSLIKKQFTVEDSVEHLEQLLTALKIDSPIILMAHSFGGIILRKFAANNSKLVKALFLIDPASEHDLDIMRAIDLPQATKEIAIMKTMGLENGLDNSFLEYWSKRPMPNYPEIKDVPVVLVATIKQYSKPPMLLLTDKGREMMGLSHKAWAENFPQGKAVLTESSFHHIHRDDPKLVMKELEKLLYRLK
jgi:pimeloyl-ACP methyl ester carboxylesterase